MRFVLEEAGVGWVPFMFWRFDREYEFGGPESRVFAPDIPLSRDAERIRPKTASSSRSRSRKKAVSGAYPRSVYGNFLWASDFPGLDSPWPHSKAMGHAPAEAALGKSALDQLVFENAVKLYGIPVTIPERQPQIG